jgi:signal peptidase I
MSPAINNDDRLFVEQSFKTINRGDIVLFYYLGHHNQSFIKRIIGLPGETIAIHESVVFIDGKVLNEPYVTREHSRLPYEYRLTLIPEDYYFVMGDNRDTSNDSRDFGPVDRKLIYAKVIGRYWTADTK